MTCPQDSYYEKNIQGSCGLCGGSYTGSAGLHWGRCGDSTWGQPGCCPEGTYFTGHQSGCGGAKCAWNCLPNVPIMTQKSMINCCSSQNLPNNSPKGYCAQGWCPKSANCKSFMTNYCRGENLKTDECKQFCRSNTGKCDSALVSFCSNPSNYELGICGCALPSDQYVMSKFKTPSGVSIPITCDRRCDINKDSIRLQSQQNCEIKSICAIDLKDVQVISKEVSGTGIKITQNCGNNNSDNSFNNKDSNNSDNIDNTQKTKKEKIIALIKKYKDIIVFIFLLLILIAFYFIL